MSKVDEVEHILLDEKQNAQGEWFRLGDRFVHTGARGTLIAWHGRHYGAFCSGSWLCEVRWDASTGRGATHGWFLDFMQKIDDEQIR